MKKILITGAGGFIGSHLVELCLKEGYQVRAFTHYNSLNKWGWLEGAVHKSDIEVVAADVRDYDAVYSAMRGCDTVLHLAALIGIPYSYLSPLAYIKTNIEGTYNILEAGRQLKLENIVVTSTSETYGTAQYIPIDEKHPLVGQSPYSASKIGADQIALSFFCSFNLPVKIARPFNTYGPRQSARAVIPSIIIQVLNGRNQVQLGRTSPMRDFTYVEDTVRGIMAIAQSDKLYGETTNIGNGIEISIRDLAKLIASLLDRKIEIIEDSQRVRPANSEVERLCCNNDKIKAITQWKPLHSFEQGLRETAKWIKEHFDAYKAEVYNV